MTVQKLEVSVDHRTVEETTYVGLSGLLDERVRLDELIPTVHALVVVDTSRLERLNSSGVREWIRFFGGLRSRGAKLVFQNCSPAVVDLLNLIRDFSCGAIIESILIPFSCQSCKSEWNAIQRVDDLASFGARVQPQEACPCCKRSMVMNDREEDYLGFALRQTA